MLKFVKCLDKRLSGSKVYVTNVLTLLLLEVLSLVVHSEELKAMIIILVAAMVLQLLFYVSQTIVEDYLQ